MCTAFAVSVLPVPVEPVNKAVANGLSDVNLIGIPTIVLVSSMSPTHMVDLLTSNFDKYLMVQFRCQTD